MSQQRTQANPARTIVAAALATTLSMAVAAAAPADEFSNYGQARDFLASHTSVVELTGEDGERVAICPDYQGRVMTSTTGDLQGHSLGWINRTFIEKGVPDKHFNNYGGEDRLWLGPEGGPFSLWFAPGAEQDLANWITPAALNDGAFKVVSSKQDPYYRLSREMKLGNAAKSPFHLEVTREIRLQKAHHFTELFGSDAGSALFGRQSKVGGLSNEQHGHQSRPRHDPRKGIGFDLELGTIPSRRADAGDRALYGG